MLCACHPFVEPALVLFFNRDRVDSELLPYTFKCRCILFFSMLSTKPPLACRVVNKDIGGSGFVLKTVIGEGSHGCVRLAVNPTTNQKVAVKVIKKKSQSIAAVQKEVAIHIQAGVHHNVVRLLSTDEDDTNIFLIMELAAGGELFDRIAPDVGVGEELAHFYFKQLVAGMSHLHQKGICHRDLKPENILLDDCGNLKISDFGLATVFRHQGATRILNTPCGTPPYLAPEIAACKYYGDRVDIWSCGIILYVLLAGNTAWAEPTMRDVEFQAFVAGYDRGLSFIPWCEFSKDVLRLIMGILHIDPDRRYTEREIRSDPWFIQPNRMLTEGRCNNPVALAEIIKRKMEDSQDDVMNLDGSQPMPYSQPEAMRIESPTMDLDGGFLPERPPELMSFSQPASRSRNDEDGGLMRDDDDDDSHLSNFSRRGNLFQDLVTSDRLTRFISPRDPAVILKVLQDTLTEFLIPHKVHHKLLKISFTTVDKRRCPLNGMILIQPTYEGKTYMVSFRKNKGDPIEFKRFYHGISDACRKIIISKT